MHCQCCPGGRNCCSQAFAGQLQFEVPHKLTCDETRWMRLELELLRVWWGRMLLLLGAGSCYCAMLSRTAELMLQTQPQRRYTVLQGNVQTYLTRSSRAQAPMIPWALGWLLNPTPCDKSNNNAPEGMPAFEAV
jgi:hypothetical protein